MRNYLRSIHWSPHQDTNQVFIVLEEEMFIDFRDSQVKISQEELLTLTLHLFENSRSDRLVDPGSSIINKFQGFLHLNFRMIQTYHAV
ncbi:hypothetical protein MHH57_15865 [Paenibacillus sp. FSL H7-0442]|uniref:hypothetical protein n=1 Tax=Paenibacillus sp. FSL H7-0442 TaxID=2921435 RepID=UPI00315880D4